LNLKCDFLVSNFAFKFNLYRYNMAFHLSGALAGTLVNMGVRGTPVLSGGPTPCFWRAPTDNDRGGEGLSYCARWRNAGIDRLALVRRQVFSRRLK
jgi:hypothetical protein